MRKIALLIMLLAIAPARGADDVTMAQDVIKAQAEAFGRDDAVAAYGHAASKIKGVFPEPEAFMAMVRNGYAPVYRHKSFEFGESNAVDGKIVQRVHIVDEQGVSWVAIYTLEHEDDGSVKITGCVLAKASQPV